MTARYVICTSDGESREVSETKFDAVCKGQLDEFSARFSPAPPPAKAFGEYLLCFQNGERVAAFRMDAKTRRCVGTTTGTGEEYYIGREHDDVVLCMFSVMKTEDGYPKVEVWS